MATSPPRQGPPPPYLHEMMPIWLLTTLWVVSGVLAVIAAFRRHPSGDGFGFAALVVPPIISAASYAWAWAMSIFGPADAGSATGWVSALIWLSIVALLITVAGWAEVPDGYAPTVEHR